MNINNIVALDSQYTLLQFLLLIPENEIEHTFIFHRGGLSSDVQNFFYGRIVKLTNKKGGLLTNIWNYILVAAKYPIILSSKPKYWGCDNLGFEQYIIRKHQLQLLEDGLLSYNEIPYKWKHKRFVRLKKMLMGPLACERTFVGEEHTCICRHLTGLQDTPIVHDRKTVVNSLGELWLASSENKKKKINQIYGIIHDEITALQSYERIVFTQPLSEDGYITEKEKIAIYRGIINYIGASKKIVIKPHPREKTNYEAIFPNAYILHSKAPIELFSLGGVIFREAYTLFSTCVLSFNYPIKVFFFGSQINKKLGDIFRKNHYGSIHAPTTNIMLQNIDFNLIKIE